MQKNSRKFNSVTAQVNKHDLNPLRHTIVGEYGCGGGHGRTRNALIC